MLTKKLKQKFMELLFGLFSKQKNDDNKKENGLTEEIKHYNGLNHYKCEKNLQDRKCIATTSRCLIKVIQTQVFNMND